MEPTYIGNKEILNLPKVAFLSSRRISSDAVLKCYDWATEMRNRGMCIITGFHSKLEKDVFHFLSKGTQPIIVVLGRKQYKNLPDELVKPLEEGRLLIISVVSTPRHSVETALSRNRYIIENADEVVFGSLDIAGKLYQLYEEIKENKKHILILGETITETDMHQKYFNKLS